MINRSYTPDGKGATNISTKNDESNKGKSFDVSWKFDWPAYICLALVIGITIFTYPFADYGADDEIVMKHVWYCGWLTAVSTGLGVFPFLFIHEPEPFYMGISNAVAGGMMVSASYSLAYEGATFTEVRGMYGFHSGFRLVLGMVVGVVFIVVIKKVLDRYEDLKMGDIQGASYKKILLIMLVMTLHSLTEGIGIGVSFGGRNGGRLGKLISLSLAVHNIPEGIAVCAVLTSRKVDKLRAALWAIFTSLPQPLCAVPAYMFIEHMLYTLPSGLGFAAGAMCYVAVFELLTEAVETTSLGVTTVVATISCGAMFVIQGLVKNL
jgi:zinc transporter, ZIP family